MHRKRRHSRCSDLDSTKKSTTEQASSPLPSLPKSRKEEKKNDSSFGSIYDLNFSDKSWADLVFEEEEELRLLEENKAKKKKDKVRFKESTQLTDLVYESFKFSTAVSSKSSPYKRTKNDDNHKQQQNDNLWRDRLRSPAKGAPPTSLSSESPSSFSPRLANKRAASTPTSSALHSPKPSGRQLTPKRVNNNSTSKHDEKKRKLYLSPEKAYRIKRLLDEDSQDTLTEALRIRNAPAKNSPNKLAVIDEDTQSTLTDRPKRLPCPPSRFPNPEKWVEPKNGYETDPAILARRDKDIRYGYASEIYRKYFAAIPKSQRIKGIHPKTPNKFLKVPRRSWDTQIRVWRRMLYAAMNMEPASSDCSFLSTTESSADVSFCSSGTDDVSALNLTDEDFPVLIADERTQATITDASSSTTKGPTDFASLTTAAK